MCIRLFESDVTGNYFMYYFSKLKWHIWHFYSFLCAISAVLQKTYKCRSCRRSKEVATQFFRLSLTLWLPVFLNGLSFSLIKAVHFQGKNAHYFSDTQVYRIEVQTQINVQVAEFLKINKHAVQNKRWSKPFISKEKMHTIFQTLVYRI